MLLTITEGSPVIETYMIMKIRHLHGFTEASSRGGNKPNVKKNLDFNKFRCMFPMQLQSIQS